MLAFSNYFSIGIEAEMTPHSQVVKPKYSIVIPAYCEEKIIGQSLEKIAKYLHSENIIDETEIVVVSAGHSDRTAEIAKSFSHEFEFFRIIEPATKIGKGRDVKLGMLEAQGNYIVFTDADLATPVEHLTSAFDLLEKQHADVVIGIRDLKSIHKGYRSKLSRSTNWLTKKIILKDISDTQCGFKAFTRESTDAIFSQLKTNGWSFDIEVLVLAKKLGYKISDIEIDDWHDPKIELGLTGENPFFTITKSFFELCKIKLRHIK